MKNFRVNLKKAIFFLIMIAILCQASIPAQAANIPPKPDNLPPTAPEGLTAVNITYTSVSLSWTKSQDNVEVKGYQVYRDGRKIITTSKTVYTNVDLIPGRKYVYTLKAYDAAGNVSVYSASLNTATLNDAQNPSAPGSLAASGASYTTVELNWEPSTDNIGVKNYEIYRNDRKIASTSATCYVCKGLTPGNTYTFFVKACDIAGNYSLQSSTISAASLPDHMAPSVPSGLKASSVAGTEVNLIWSPSSDNVKVKGYEIFRDGTKLCSTSITSYSSKSLIPGKSYVYSVRAYDATGNISDNSNPLKITTPADLQAPTAPTGLKAGSVNGSSVSLNWNASSDNIKVKGYRIYCDGIEIASSSRTSRTVKCPAGLGIYIFRVKAYDLSDNLSGDSNTVTVIIPGLI